MLIEMIEPKIREINEKFSKGEKLTQDDINTLLLKSQYNHINHLDEKLDETVGYVKNLENEFKSEFNRLESEFKRLEQKYEKDFNTLRKDFENLKIDIEVTIQKSLNKNMIMLITIIGLFFTIIKIIDKF